MIENIDFFGITISSFTEEELWINVDKDILNKSSAVYYCTGFYNIILLEKYPELYLYSSNVNVTLMDGHLFKKFINILGYKIKYELSMPRFVLSLLEHLNSDKKVFALGGDNQVNCLAIESIVNKYKITNVAGRNGYFKESEELEIINEINNFAPDILLIGISSPIKERFFYKWKSRKGRWVYWAVSPDPNNILLLRGQLFPPVRIVHNISMHKKKTNVISNHEMFPFAAMTSGHE